MKVCIVGAGSIGASIGARLAGAGHEVCLVARGEHLRQVRSSGLHFVDRVAGVDRVDQMPASDTLSDFGLQDLVVIAVKAPSLPAVVDRLHALIGPETVVMPALNGLPWWYFYRSGGQHEGLRLKSLDPDGSLQRALDMSHIVGCVVHLGAELLQPGTVQLTAGRRLIIGEPDGTITARLQRLQQALEGAGFDCVRTDRIRVDIWVKLIGNLSFNPIAALTGYRMDQICADPELLVLIRRVLSEGITVARAFGVEIPVTPDQRIEIARQLGAARISMLQDLEQRRPLELAAIVESVMELADLAGLKVPMTEALCALVRARARSVAIPV
jgi:2-dehydropantoate 2-reductase